MLIKGDGEFAMKWGRIAERLSELVLWSITCSWGIDDSFELLKDFFGISLVNFTNQFLLLSLQSAEIPIKVPYSMGSRLKLVSYVVLFIIIIIIEITSKRHL